MLSHAVTCCHIHKHAATCCHIHKHAVTCCHMLSHARTCCYMTDTNTHTSRKQQYIFTFKSQIIAQHLASVLFVRRNNAKELSNALTSFIPNSCALYSEWDSAGNLKPECLGGLKFSYNSLAYRNLDKATLLVTHSPGLNVGIF